MLKWTATQQKFSNSFSSANNSLRTPRVSPSQLRKRRATFDNKENIITSTPMGRSLQKSRFSQVVLAPLTDILNITPEPIVKSSDRMIPHQYASTLPKFEEEYSPMNPLPQGKAVALRGLLPDTYIGNPRYLRTPEQPRLLETLNEKKPSLKKRKLELEFGDSETATSTLKNNVTSTKMGDQTLDKLIDAILDSARKETKKRPRKSFNLRRRTRIKSTTELVDSILSPSYTPADDPASDLSIIRVEAVTEVVVREAPSKKIKTQDDCMKYFEIGLALPSIYV